MADWFSQLAKIPLPVSVAAAAISPLIVLPKLIAELRKWQIGNRRMRFLESLVPPDGRGGVTLTKLLDAFSKEGRDNDDDARSKIDKRGKHGDENDSSAEPS